MSLNSVLFVGQVRHRRFTPQRHALNYSLFMPCIDLDEWPTLMGSTRLLGERWWHWARFKRQDYVGEGDLKAAVQQKVAELTGERLTGKVMALVHLRYFGLYFSPVNFYYVYDEQNNWRYLLAEVSNTPWNERHYYAVPAGQTASTQWQHLKAFHVSPFNPINQTYQWTIREPDDHLMVHLECWQDEKQFDATLQMQAQPFTAKKLLWLLVKTPVMSVKVMFGIYWEAMKLWIKGVPVHDHPDKEPPHNKENPPC
ncbi:DUF1365 domain-containing protein [Vibrio tritonius]|uniref:DUF1365 domain-containing protein n=1 Tax=Vibrio tritonius TaxID=1435069 RepID=UPI00315D9FF5